jgi:hypothetical protein
LNEYFVTRFHKSVPWLSEDQMREVDRAMVDEYGITVLQMMEHADRNLVDVQGLCFSTAPSLERMCLWRPDPAATAAAGYPERGTSTTWAQP